jgi:hypothetical protein
VTVSGNGQNNFIAANGWDLRLRAIAANRALTDTISTYPTTGGVFSGAGSTTFNLYYRIPIAMDPTTLVGALYAQSEATNLVLQVARPADSDLFNITAGTISITGTVYVEVELFEVPYHPSQPDTLVIPDLTVLHGFVSNDNAVANQVLLDTQLFRINGQLERLFFYTVDKSSANATIVPTTQYVQTQLIYGANTVPYTFNPQQLLRWRNVKDYRVAFPDGMYCIDFVADNPARDLVLLEGVTNLRLRTQYTTAPTGGSYVHFVQETLFA